MLLVINITLLVTNITNHLSLLFILFVYKFIIIFTINCTYLQNKIGREDLFIFFNIGVNLIKPTCDIYICTIV